MSESCGQTVTKKRKKRRKKAGPKFAEALAEGMAKIPESPGPQAKSHEEWEAKTPARAELLKLNLGGGATEIPGYLNIDRANGQEAYPLSFPNESCQEVRASHLLEHFPHASTLEVLKEWARVLAPGGRMRIAVPDLDKITTWYTQGTPGGADLPLEGYLMGGQGNPNDQHRAIFNRQKLTHYMALAGLERINFWQDNVADCSSMEVSLNLEGYKPGGAKGEEDVLRMNGTKAVLPLKTQAVLSIPRLGFLDHMFCVYRALIPLGVEVRRTMGAYWGMCLERGFSAARAEGVEAILALDYDTIFTMADVIDLVRLLHDNPDVDAIAPVQMHQTGERTLWTKQDSQWQNVPTVDLVDFKAPLLQINTAHFGCTIIRTSALEKIPHPWFFSRPSADGTWSEGRVDADIWFWRKFQEAGRKLCMATHVTVGHLAALIRWPGLQMEPGPVQSAHDFEENGKPKEGIWAGP